MKEISRYYDKYSGFYDSEREHEYYQMVNHFEISLLEEYIKGKKVLEIGCGTGMILEKASKMAKEVVGIDISKEMLSKAKSKGLNVRIATATKLPFQDESFDVVYSFKVLAHIPEIEKAIKEILRVIKKGGVVILEFYNPYSLRYIINKIDKIFFSNRKVYIRYDSYWKIKSYLPYDAKIMRTRAIRIFTPASFLFRIPLVSDILNWLESSFCDSFLRFLGGFFIVIIKCQKPPIRDKRHEHI